ncbi:major facilitator superfamily (MFS) transporter [Legionella busanensis]|uniref:Major facilitator superfamily (MFS) transporter n=1 Tax=Legionella busanensis TaxID=190655 RepID=A0A378JMM9_9GAMM|nr:MFS transporter [Legionella busanensis]STX51459.1 major facilitator superfamily (MFS) transporter [Legionella busanensis]
MADKKKFMLLVMVALMYTTVCMETDIYVPAFPDMKLFFHSTAAAIQKVLSINFIGIFIGSLLFGPLSDVFGRKSMLQLGLGLFNLTSWGCLWTNHFDIFLLCRFGQGVGAAAPMVITFAMLLESYPPQKVAQLCGGLNLFIAGVMAAAPVLGSFLNIYFGWQSTFLLIALLTTFSLIGTIFFIYETLPTNERSTLSIPTILKNYCTVLSSFPYMGAAFVCYILFGTLVLFTANLSLIFIDYLGISKSSYGFYQAMAPGAFALFSFLSIGIIAKYGMNKTKFMGLITSILGAILLLLTSSTTSNPFLICVAMVILSAGITLAAPIYGIQSANVYPEMRGIATGMSNALRYVVIASMVALGMNAFNGSVGPLALLIGGAIIIACMLAVGLARRESKLVLDIREM